MTSILGSSTPHPAAPGEPENRISILLVDDDPKNLLALESILDSPEHRLVKVQTADEALLALMKDDYAAIVLDVQMPDLNGIELARLIKQRRRTQHIPILFLTAHYRENEHAVLGYDVGAVDYLTKPVHPAVLRSKVSVFVDLFRKTRALEEMNRNMETEIAERKIAEERFRVVVEAAPSAMLVFTREGTIVLVNSQAEELFGRSREHLLQHSITDCLPTEVLAWLPQPGSPIPPELLKPDGAAFEWAAQRPDGTLVPASVSFTPIRSPEGTRVLASIIDTSERHRAEEAWRAANAELEAKNLAMQRQAEERVLRIRAEAARAEAETANAAKDRFLAMLSHELRTPLSPVLHALTLLDEDGLQPEAFHENLQIIRRNVQLEARLIDDLLDLARIRNGKLKLQLRPTEAHELLRHAFEICRPALVARRLQSELRLNAENTVIQADPARLQQIFWNLISNAVKFTPENGTITISTSNDEDGDLFIVEVADTGVGIEPTKLARIFDAFEQAAERSPTGLGLGLAICKALTEFHGGTITAHSLGIGHGATFSARFAVANLLVATAAPQAPSTPAPTIPLRLLLVEDHQDTAATLRRLLLRQGYLVECAHTFAQALQVATDNEFDILVTDIGLPDGNGVDLFRAIRQLPKYEHLRGIALSGFGTDNDINRSEQAGFSEHLTKPVDFEQIKACLARLALATERGGATR